MAFEVYGPTPLDGDVLLFRVVEQSPGSNDEWSIPLDGLMTMGHTVLWQCDIVTGSGTVLPELGELDGWTTDERGHIAQVDAAAANHRVGEYKNFLVREGALYGRSNATSAPGRVETLLYLKRGPAL